MWFSKTSNEIIQQLNTDLNEGLSSEEAAKRLNEFGANKLKAKPKKTILQLFFAQINDILIYILLGAAVLSAIMKDYNEAIIILIVVLINAVVGVVQESKAEKALEALKKLSTPKAVVKRDGELKEIPSEEVVPGDIIILDAGRYVPADLRLIETANLKIEESALTGESVPSEKDGSKAFPDEEVPLGDQINMAFSSTLATYGRGIGIAVETGMNTQIGKIAKMLDDTENEMTPLQKKLAELGKYLGIGAIAICVIMFIVGIIQGQDIFDMLLTAISLAVAAIPEGLAAIVAIVLAMGVQRMIKENAIVRKLPAVETLGAVNVVCSDKTGTLTQNKMTVTKFYSNSNLKSIDDLDINDPSEKMLLENLVLCNDATYSEASQTGDPTEIALLVAGAKYDLIKESLQSNHARCNEAPFDSDRKLMSTVNYYGDNSYRVYTKGAIDNILKICKGAYINGEIVPMTEDLEEEIMKASNSMSDEALRVLGAAYKEISSYSGTVDDFEKDLIFVGLVGMIDPPRLEVKDSIGVCKHAGIKTIMITGDHKKTAFAIAKELNIAENESQTISGAELDKLSDDELSTKIDDLRVFARVSPEHKVKIVKAFKSKGNIVSMTGDGVNDAPSLKTADIGVAMGITGTDVAKGAADMVLTDDNFSTIVSAIEEGRNIFNNIKKSIIFLLSCNLGEIFALFIAILLGWDAPLRPIHILWVNLITDTLPALSLGVDPGDKNVMDNKPRDPKESLFKHDGVFMVINGIFIGALTLIAYQIGLQKYGSVVHAQTMAFVVLSVSQLFHALNLRHPKKSIFQVGLFTNKYLIFSIIIGVFLQDIIITVPFLRTVFDVFDLTINDWMIVSLFAISPLVLNEIAKIFKRRKDA
ncbi:calcium-translocating P-type ATPase, PMCA-type [Clostridium cadaveris]|uniref:P-type Ca(2+) transporter n=3 Tax=Clostridium TaxID=1485 RepID=A0A1I2J6G4_9CLOT|nr:calcium-translocating P-type ATPase, PMCA-type [Clostridium cadaveris]MDM8311373.1 calcium-translocating P-type ATPase, PMCA-type [Clostridium cadaveris]MDY4950525.1 calcium-translocating P-type ATPase, PMCA-type [Clostridium cadaveris]NME63281.1 calcium-translocating P-type ATPase, PMCA-type [Clostridium cadaveris]UFH63567.1 calcium-translocating P-type ATPase, PMCA-type [Clostridium cadaveris]SFF48536.1 Ca2+-transporting ATPase [Clostridium cadaveris]